MSLGSGLRLGGIFLEVGVDRTRIVNDLRALRSDLERFARDNTIHVPVSTTGGGGSRSSGSSVSGGSGGGDAQAKLQANFASAMAPALTIGRDIVTSIRSGNSQIIGELTRIAASSAATAQAQREQLLAARDLFRADRADFRRAGIGAGVQQMRTGRFQGIKGPTGPIDTLPADVRFFGGIGFEGGRGFKPGGDIFGRRQSQAASEGAAEGAPFHNDVQATASAFRSATTEANKLAIAFRGVAQSMRPAQAASQQALPGVRTTRAQQMAFAQARGLPAPVPTPDTDERQEPDVTRIGATRAAKLAGATGGTFVQPRPGRVGFFRRNPKLTAKQMMGLMDEPVTPSSTPTPTPSRGRQGAGRLGIASPLIGPADSPSARLGTAIGTVARRGVQELIRLVPRATGLIGTLGDTALFSFNRFQAAVRSVTRSIARMRVTLAPVGRLASLPFKAALLPLRLFSSNINQSVQAIGSVRTAFRAIGGGFALPFRVALAPIRALIGGFRQLLALTTLLGPIMAAVFIGKGVAGAADMIETVNFAQVTFGEFANVVQETAADLAEEFGLIEQASLDAAASFGALITGMGVGQKEAANMSSELTRLTADLSSFRNVTQEEAASALEGALRGRFRSISKFGVVIDAEQVKNLAELRGEVTRTSTAMARFDLITQGLATAQGDLAATMNTVPNLFRELKGRISNLGSNLGATLLPAWRELLLLFNDFLSSSSAVGQAAFNVFEQIGSGVQQAIRFVRQAFVEWEATIDLVKALFQVIISNAGSIAVFIATTFAEAFRSAVQIGVQVFQIAFAAVREALKTIWRAIGQDLIQALGEAALKAHEKVVEGFSKGRALRRSDFEEPAPDAANQVDPIKIAGKEIQRLFEKFDGFQLPKLELDIAAGLQRTIDESVAKIQKARVRGDDDEGREARKRIQQDREEEAEKAKEATTRRSGQMVGAEQLRELQQESVFEKRQVSLLERIALNTEALNKGLKIGDIGGLVQNAVAAP